MLGTVEARDQFLALAATARNAAGEAAFRATPVGRFVRGNRPFEVSPIDERSLPPPPAPLRMEADQYPWQWSAAVLAGLFVLSLWILTTRVKSLDRLK